MIHNPESIIKQAVDIAEELPEKYQVAAFAELVRHALGSAAVSADPDPGAHPMGGPSPPADDAGWGALAGDLPDDFVVADKGTRDQQTVWAVITLCQDGLEATSATVREAILVHLGVTPESLQHTSRTLRGQTPRYLNRQKRQEGSGYAYVATENALEVFDGLQEGGEE